jgi:hypothetical protein
MPVLISSCPKVVGRDGVREVMNICYALSHYVEVIEQ